ncbi:MULTISPECIES: DUF3168 domain-containing protein [unclassified Caulobacter]|uniref:DUF3168 domain-containing protein n=1 Tax=unclassified Caulobacter TaxID=2648921 RepID=UPI0006F5C618|nr:MULTISPECIES: DUF3168 domain-containing protein [unclassified Caulobacter]KQV56135.1 hypothetical protein ASC62_19775 [Caulobacter sp. Root342]KQV70690.1 hypothetical protein ASC70_03480 [Caulobacter sp. Root343]
MTDKPLIDALVATLKAAPAVTALTGQRIHAMAPRLPTYPCVVVSRSEGRPVGGVDGEGIEHLLTLTCASRFGGPEEARALVAAVRAALHDARPALAGRRLVNLRVPYADVFAGADRETTLGIVRVRAVTEAP